ncbi:MAG: radical SAM protein [Bacilli bacterium]|nr:radical SAM protein [Bacilli bacterium]
MKVYINDSVVVINNKFEDRIFVYDRLNRVEYNINNQTFEILEEIKKNDHEKKDLLDMYGNDIIEQLFALNIITLSKQKNINNVKKLEKYNNVRIFVELTDKCNLKCKHCYGGFECKKNHSLDIEYLKKMIDNATKNGVYQFDLTGGEPFLYNNLEDLLSYLYDAGMMVRIFTNLTLFNNKFKHLILKYGVKDIVTSIDSCIKEDHELFRGQVGCFEKTVNAVNELKKNNISVSVNTMIGQHNKEHIDELVEFIDSLKVKSVLDVIVPEGRAKNLNENIRDSSKIIRDIYKKYETKIDEKAITISCGVGNRFIYVKSDGNIYLCPSLIDSKYILGNIKEFDTILIWKYMNENFNNMGCKYKTEKCRSCNGGCRARALKLNGNIDANDDVYCIINEVSC